MRGCTGASDGDGGGVDDVPIPAFCALGFLCEGREEVMEVGEDDVGENCVPNESLPEDVEKVEDAVEARRSCEEYESGRAVCTIGTGVGTGAFEGTCMVRWETGCI